MTPKRHNYSKIYPNMYQILFINESIIAPAWPPQNFWKNISNVVKVANKNSAKRRDGTIRIIISGNKYNNGNNGNSILLYSKWETLLYLFLQFTDHTQKRTFEYFFPFISDEIRLKVPVSIN